MRVLRALIPFLIAAVIVSAGPVGTAGASGATTKQLRNDLLSRVNAARRSHGTHALRMNWRVSNAAWHHSQRMARRHSVYHTTDLYAVVRRYKPHTWGENVGMAGTTRQMHRLFMKSPPHRANILNGAFKRIGVGVVRASGRVWVTLDFYGG
jgi:uncharacterized protein YkwD